MKTEVILCDECKEKVAEHKCEICNKDICNSSDCINKIELRLQSIAIDEELFICKDCNEKIFYQEDEEERNYEILNQIKLKECFINQVKNLFALDTLEKEPANFEKGKGEGQKL